MKPVTDALPQTFESHFRRTLSVFLSEVGRCLTLPLDAILQYGKSPDVSGRDQSPIKSLPLLLLSSSAEKAATRLRLQDRGVACLKFAYSEISRPRIPNTNCVDAQSLSLTTHRCHLNFSIVVVCPHHNLGTTNA